MNNSGSDDTGKRGTWQRRMFILEKLFSEPGKEFPVEDLASECKDKSFAVVDWRPIVTDLKHLEEKSPFPVKLKNKSKDASGIWLGSNLKELFARTKIGKRLGTHVGEKSEVAEAAVEIILNQVPDTTSILFGTGTTAYFTAECLIKQLDKMKADVFNFYSNNILVLLSIFQANAGQNIIFEMPRGHLVRESALMQDSEGILHLARRRVDVVVTSFARIVANDDKGLSFMSDREEDKKEKQMNLNPHESCKLVLIPIILDNLGRHVGFEVATEANLNGDSGRKYIIITNRPKTQEERKKVTQLEDAIKASGLETVIEICYPG